MGENCLREERYTSLARFYRVDQAGGDTAVFALEEKPALSREPEVLATMT